MSIRSQIGPMVFTFLTLTGLAWGVLPESYEYQTLRPPSRLFSGAPSDSFHAYDVRHYRIDMNLPMDTGAFWAHERIGIMSRLANMDTFSLNMDSLVCDSVKRDTIRLVFTRVPGWLRIQLDRPFAIGESLDVDIFYHRNPGTPNRGFYWVSARQTGGHAEAYPFAIPEGSGYWFPSFDQIWDKAERGCMINITVPDSFSACANGKLDSVTVNPTTHTKTFWWNHRYGIGTYKVAFAISRYVTWSQYVVRAPGDTVEIQYYVWPEDSVASDTGFRYIPDIMSYYIRADRFAYFPFEKLKFAVCATMSYMSLQTVIYWPRFFSNPDSLGCAHEMAHQWWGGLVNSSTWSHAWLQEGFANYSMAGYAAEREGRISFNEMMAQMAHGYFQEDSTNRYPLINPPFPFTPTVYCKGAWVQHMLRYVAGDTSSTPSIFFAAVRAYADSFKYRNASTADYERINERIFGQNLAWFFDEWAYQAGYPQYTVNWFGVPESSNWRIIVDITQNNGPGAPPVFHMPVEFLFHLTGKDTLVHYPINTSPQHNEFVVSARPDSAIFDPGYWILKQARITNVGVETGSPATLLTTTLFPVHPNPSRGSFRIEYALAGKGRVHLSVYNVAGQMVRELVDEVQPPGRYSASWDGRDQEAHRLPSGVYFYRLQTETFSDTKKAVVVR